MPWSAQHIAPQSSLALKLANNPTATTSGSSWSGFKPQVIPTMGAGTQNREPRTAIADASAMPSVQRLKERVGQTEGLKDTKLGSRSPSTAPAAFNLLQTSTFKTPYAPEFLTNAVAGLNETNSYTAMMHDEWRNRLLSESEERPDLIPALTAASVQSGAHFSYATPGTVGGTGGAAVKREPSYWEQKLAFKDLGAAREQMANATEQSRQVGSGLGTFMSPADVAAEQARLKGDYLAGQQASNLAGKVLGIPPTGQTLTGWNTANNWSANKNIPSGWW